MLGWEFPPFAAGGLGVACFGLAKALNAQQVDVLFVLPKAGRGAGGGAGGADTGARRVMPLPGSHAGAGGPAIQRTIAPASVGEVQRAVVQRVEQASAAEAGERAAGLRAVEAAAGGDASQAGTGVVGAEEGTAAQVAGTMPRVEFQAVDVLLSPYLTVREYRQRYLAQVSEKTGYGGAVSGQSSVVSGQKTEDGGAESGVGSRESGVEAGADAGSAVGAAVAEQVAQRAGYAEDLIAETQRYASLAMGVARHERFEVVHAHDWMTFEAALAVAAAKGKPLVLQIHSTELDRAGVNANPAIMEIERQGMMAADAIVAVSYRTKTQLIEKYRIDPRKIHVVYNAPPAPAPQSPPTANGDAGEGHGANGHEGKGAGVAGAGKRREKIVLFLGRLTQQKGPEYFLHAARRVLELEKHVRFVMAGGGDLAEQVMATAEELGISRHVVFTGFLRKRDVDKVFKMADVYVMPSVSEPFGIAPLEALSHDVPVIISKQSGVAEVLKHVLKVDFWDTEELANKILAVLRHPPLAATLRDEGRMELRHLNWDDSARRVIEVYENLLQARRGTVTEEVAAGAV
jgi:glycogen synthase